ncbi:type II toxin-antitoxin system HicB family antitoxin [Methylobacterium sp. BTF04]|uniref:type II toxin-antitoxin system HicB family antitoxin n=1 Tax=Methylobacterium sp. BTF04 TaxID=2708300 RepID=UPI0013CFB95D|nr:type II toxin-antitoxin system HicB family antitoxin [Methylobacterium sp. BTF04]NEU14160.1 type II toxin-antitoxin system HicB family antitoxin [Methylobacterium sp. BTF04]
MNVMRYNGLRAHAEFDAEDGLFVGRLAGINDVVGFHADSVAGLTAAFHEAVDDYLVTCERLGKAAEKPYSGRMLFRVAPEVHAQAALAARLSGKSLNYWGEEALRAPAKSAIPAQDT